MEPTINTYIKPSPIHGVGLFADKEIKAGEEVVHADGYDLNRNIDEWIKYLKNTKSKSMALCLGYCCINHSDTPNTHRGPEDSIFASVDIAANTEITENYTLLPDTQNQFKNEFIQMVFDAKHNPEAFDARLQIEFAYAELQVLLSKLEKIKPLSPIEKLVDQATGNQETEAKKIYDECIKLVKKVIECKKEIGADSKQDKDFLAQLESINALK